MKRNMLGRTGIDIPAFCLGTMTFGTQTPETESHAQIDMSLDHGLEFLDTAEMYPVNPVSAETQGRSEQIIGNWFARTGRRSDVILATKHSGAGLAHVRGGAPISAQTISQAIDGSLERLQSDYIDLYQFHWPNRGSYMFRQNWHYDPSQQDRADTLENMEECLEALQGEVDRGRIRAFGLSNESAWGTAQWLRLAQKKGAPRVASIQNEYSLLCRMYDTDLAELGMNEDVGLLAFSPLAAGLLTGKYADGALPDASRMTYVANLGGRNTERAHKAVAAYVALARDHDVDPIQMALAWARDRPFMGSVIFGATRLEQLDHILAGADLELTPELTEAIDATHRSHPMPY